MRLSRKLAVGTAVGVVPFLIGQAPAAAAFTEDADSRNETITLSTSDKAGDTVECGMFAQHTVDSDTGDLEVHLRAGIQGGPCQGDLSLNVAYVGRNGETLGVEHYASEARTTFIKVGNAGSTAVQVYYSVLFDNCASNCDHQLETQTK